MCTVYRTRAHIIMHLACNTHPCHAYIPRTLELEQQIFFSELLGDGFLKKGKNYRFMCQLFDKTNKKLCGIYHQSLCTSLRNSILWREPSLKTSNIKTAEKDVGLLHYDTLLLTHHVAIYENLEILLYRWHFKVSQLYSLYICFKCKQIWYYELYVLHLCQCHY